MRNQRTSITNSKTKFHATEVIKRSLSSVILFPIVIYCIYKGEETYKIFLGIIVALSIRETIAIACTKKTQHSIQSRIVWMLCSICYIVWAFFSFIKIREINYGFAQTLWLLFTVSLTDIGAYVVGIAVGGPKIIPTISPNKTWSGCIGGILLALLFSIIFQYIVLHIQYVKNSELGCYPLLTLLISVVAQIGDFLESIFKRKFQVKNSGNLLPGHGGILDRIDGLLLAGIVLAFIAK